MLNKVKNLVMGASDLKKGAMIVGGVLVTAAIRAALNMKKARKHSSAVKFAENPAQDPLERTERPLEATEAPTVEEE